MKLRGKLLLARLGEKFELSCVQVIGGFELVGRASNRVCRGFELSDVRAGLLGVAVCRELVCTRRF